MLHTLRKRRLSSDAGMNRRHSEYFAMQPPTIAEGRASEQIPRNVSSAHFLSPAMAATGSTPSSLNNNSSTPRLPTAERSIPHAPQEEHSKFRRFSMMKFRNASDPQLSARARLQAAQASEAPPPLPKREWIAHFTECAANYLQLRRLSRLPQRSK